MYFVKWLAGTANLIFPHLLNTMSKVPFFRVRFIWQVRQSPDGSDLYNIFLEELWALLCCDVWVSGRGTCEIICGTKGVFSLFTVASGNRLLLCAPWVFHTPRIAATLSVVFGLGFGRTWVRMLGVGGSWDG